MCTGKVKVLGNNFGRKQSNCPYVPYIDVMVIAVMYHGENLAICCLKKSVLLEHFI
jgi:hypothetical protein